jgi:thiol-disulfide isomerase/thioredoxin
MNSIRMTLGLAAVLLAAVTGSARLESSRLHAAQDARDAKRARVEQAQGIGWSHGPSRHRTTDGRTVRIGATAADTMLQFFLPYCPACRLEAPTWNDFARECELAGVQFVAIACASDGLSEFAAEFAARYPIIEDGAGELATEFGVEAYPELVLVDRFGGVETRDAALVTLSSQGGTLDGAAAEWPEGARRSILEALVRSVVPDARSIAEIPMQSDGPLRIVCEGQAGVIAYGSLLSRRSFRAECSSLECLVLLDASGSMLAVLPLDQHAILGRTVGRKELEAWSTASTLPADPSWLQQVFAAELRDLRADFGFGRAPIGMAVNAR